MPASDKSAFRNPCRSKNAPSITASLKGSFTDLNSLSLLLLAAKFDPALPIELPTECAKPDVALRAAAVAIPFRAPPNPKPPPTTRLR